jgi:hypothetical protein
MFGNKKKKQAALMTEGARGVGTIINVRDTGMTINDNPRVKMTFQIEPLDGSPAFQGEKTATVSRVRLPQIGARHPVFYDRTDPSEFIFVQAVAPEGLPNIVAMFGDAFGPDGSGVGMPAVAAAPVAAAPPAAEDPLDRLKKLADLHSSGVLTDAEFETQKAAILSPSS